MRRDNGNGGHQVDNERFFTSIHQLPTQYNAMPGSVNAAGRHTKPRSRAVTEFLSGASFLAREKCVLCCQYGKGWQDIDNGAEAIL